MDGTDAQNGAYTAAIRALNGPNQTAIGSPGIPQILGEILGSRCVSKMAPFLPANHS